MPMLLILLDYIINAFGLDYDRELLNKMSREVYSIKYNISTYMPEVINTLNSDLIALRNAFSTRLNDLQTELNKCFIERNRSDVLRQIEDKYLNTTYINLSNFIYQTTENAYNDTLRKLNATLEVYINNTKTYINEYISDMIDYYTNQTPLSLNDRLTNMQRAINNLETAISTFIIISIIFFYGKCYRKHNK